MLLDHPFLAGVDEPELPAVPSSSWTEADFEHGGYSFSDDDDSTSCSFCAERWFFSVAKQWFLILNDFFLLILGEGEQWP